MPHQLAHIQTRYRDEQVAAKYDRERYHDLIGRWNNRAMWRALRKALACVPANAAVLDIPCGTGRFSWHFAELGHPTLASDISLEMIGVARRVGAADAAARPRFFQGDIFNLPFRGRPFGAAVCIRFMNLVERPHRVAAVRSLGQVAQYVIVSYDHKYTWKYVGRWVRHSLGLKAKLSPRLSRRELEEELAATGLKLRALIVVAPLVSEAWIAVLECPVESRPSPP